MGERGSEIVKGVLEAALMANSPYAADQFARAVQIAGIVQTPHHPQSIPHIKIPKEPGERAYTNIISHDVQDGRLSATDATVLAATNRRSVMDGLNLLFPPHALKEYLNHALDTFDFAQATDGSNVRGYSNVDLMPPIHPSAHGNKHDAGGKSPMHINRDFHVVQSAFDGEVGKNPHNADIMRAYKFMETHPEYGLGVKWLTGVVTDYTREMRRQMDEIPAFTSLKAGGLSETLTMFEHVDARAFMDGRLPVGVMAAVTHKTGVDSKGIPTEPDAEQVGEGMQSILHANIFKRPRVSPSGESFIGICPATRFNVNTLSLDLGNEGKPGDMAINRFVKKVKDVGNGVDPAVTEQDTITVKNATHEYSAMMHKILNTPDALAAMAELPSVSPSKGGRCPFHQTP